LTQGGPKAAKEEAAAKAKQEEAELKVRVELATQRYSFHQMFVF
jgi:hypothetical protein